MARIHFFKDGKRPNGSRITDTFEISAAQLSALPGCSSQYSAELPAIGPDVAASVFAAYFYVVVEIPEGEAIDEYPYEGFYLLEDISPAEVRAALEQQDACRSVELSAVASR